jgi:hypothetical protein
MEEIGGNWCGPFYSTTPLFPWATEENYKYYQRGEFNDLD